MKRQMLKIKRIAGAKRVQLARKASIQRFFGDKKPKFFQIGSGTFAENTFVTRPMERLVYITEFDKATDSFRPFAAAFINRHPNAISISGIKAVVKKTGTNIFRLIINEAVAFAKESNLEKITIDTHSKLKPYCKELGFKFEDHSNPWHGVFYVKAKK